MSDKVWVLTIDHRHGSEVHTFRDETGARSALLDWVHQYWDEVASRGGCSQAPPADPDEAIDLYFEAHGSEWYSIGESPLS